MAAVNRHIVHKKQYVPHLYEATDIEDHVPARVYVGNIIQTILLSLAGLLVIRFIFNVLRANPMNPIASFVYGVTEPFVWPFKDIFPVDFSATGLRIDLPALLATFFLVLTAWLVAGLTMSDVGLSDEEN